MRAAGLTAPSLSAKLGIYPLNAEKPGRVNRKKKLGPLLLALWARKAPGIKGGICHKPEIELAYNSNHIEGGRLIREQPRYIFETNIIEFEKAPRNVDDIIEKIQSLMDICHAAQD